MSEMLGNQYFLARNYSAAKEELEKCILNHPDDKEIKKKLLVCYIQTNYLKTASEYFLYFIINDIRYITKTDPIKDDCPCVELINEYEKQGNESQIDNDLRFKLAMIWLFIDAKRSLEYFQKLQILNYKLDSIDLIIDKISEHTKSAELN